MAAADDAHGVKDRDLSLKEIFGEWIFRSNFFFRNASGFARLEGEIDGRIVITVFVVQGLVPDLHDLRHRRVADGRRPHVPCPPLLRPLPSHPHLLPGLRGPPPPPPPAAPPSSLRFLTGLSGSVSAIIAVCLLSAAAEILHSSVSLQWHMSQRVVSAVPDWSSVRNALDVGCGRGMLLNSVALRLKKEGGCGRVVGLVQRRQRRRAAALAALRTARAEGVQEYVTCREGDATRLPFADGYFDVVVSAGFLDGVGSEAATGRRKGVTEAAERGRVLGEAVRVMKPGGVGVIWDLMHVQEYVQRLHEMKMEEIRVSERVTAYLVNTHIVSFRKPMEAVASDPAQLEWRTNISCC
ncbi:hypothetical protein QJS10_CPA01g02329 [Acorus calamus]|uniref:Methyltransferase type 11 domain-containing protein n=1 Tax=Acorus calamus TaxID=4465 RepID=A0AAV9FU38_ACOCL|nr:hypothetical protein QJS10_CPA01g02329 [Acorus calamus]